MGSPRKKCAIMKRMARRAISTRTLNELIPLLCLCCGGFVAAAE